MQWCDADGDSEVERGSRWNLDVDRGSLQADNGFEPSVTCWPKRRNKRQVRFFFQRGGGEGDNVKPPQSVGRELEVSDCKLLISFSRKFFERASILLTQSRQRKGQRRLSRFGSGNQTELGRRSSVATKSIGCHEAVCRQKAGKQAARLSCASADRSVEPKTASRACIMGRKAARTASGVSNSISVSKYPAGDCVYTLLFHKPSGSSLCKIIASANTINAASNGPLLLRTL